MRSVIVILMAASVLLWASACSKVSFGYRNAPLIAAWWIDDVFDLPEAQHDAVRAALDDTLRWHSGTPREELVGLMRSAAARLAHPLRDADVEWAFTAMETHARQVGRHFGEQLADRWPAMSAEALAALDARLARRRAELAHKRADESAQMAVKRRTERIVDELEDWFGPLTAAQQVYIARHAAVRLDERVWQRELARRHARLLEILHTRPPQGLATWIADVRAGRPPEVADVAARQRTVYRAFWVGLFARAEPAQIARAQSRLTAWADDLAAVAPMPSTLARRQDADCATC